jgi:hypothetical protein
MRAKTITEALELIAEIAVKPRRATTVRPLEVAAGESASWP